MYVKFLLIYNFSVLLFVLLYFKIFMGPFYDGWGSAASDLQNHYEEAEGKNKCVLRQHVLFMQQVVVFFSFLAFLIV